MGLTTTMPLPVQVAVRYRISILGFREGFAAQEAASTLGRIFKKDPDTIRPLLYHSGAITFSVPALDVAGKYQNLLGQLGCVCGVTAMEEISLIHPSAAPLVGVVSGDSAPAPAAANSPDPQPEFGVEPEVPVSLASALMAHAAQAEVEEPAAIVLPPQPAPAVAAPVPAYDPGVMKKVLPGAFGESALATNAQIFAPAQRLTPWQRFRRWLRRPGSKTKFCLYLAAALITLSLAL